LLVLHPANLPDIQDTGSTKDVSIRVSHAESAHERAQGVFSAVVEEVAVASGDTGEEVLDLEVVVDIDVSETVFEASEET
jgi:hypothetical protein